MSFIKAQVHPGVLDPAEYHDQKIARGNREFPMSPSALKEFGRCPARWLRGYNPPDSESKDYGSLLDCLVLTPELFGFKYALQPDVYVNEKGETKPWNNNATVCKEWHTSLNGAEALKPAKLAEATTARASLHSDEVITNFINSSDKQVLVTSDWQDEATGLTVPARCLIDMVPRKDSEFAKCIGDLKSSFTAALQPFSRNVFKLGYHVQAAFDLDMFVAATGEDRNTWCFIVQESFEPYQSGKRILSQDFLEVGRTEYRRLMALYCRCLKAKLWPGYDDNDEAVQGWSIVAPEPWMGSESMFAPKFNDEAPEEQPENYDIIP